MLPGLALATVLLAVLLAMPAFASAAPVPSAWSWTDRGPTLMDVSCVAGDRCVAVGGDGNILRSNADGAGPQAWSAVTLPHPAKLAARLLAVNCETNGLCIAVSDPAPTLVSTVFRSTDFGATWTSSGPLPAATAGTIQTQRGAAVDCDASGDCTIAGQQGGVWRSTDDGATWTPLAAASKLGLGYAAIACPAAGTCVLAGVGTTAVLKGTTATSVPFPTTIGKLTAFACESATACTAAGNIGKVATLTLPANTWSAPVILAGTDNTLLSLSCPAADRCVGVTKAGGVLRTTARSDGRWSARKSGAAALSAVDCVADACTSVGPAARWYASKDLGIGWRQGNAAAGFVAAACTTADTCLAGGDKALGSTTTAGNLWTSSLEAPTLGIDGVTCIFAPTCLALGKDKILASSDGNRSWQNRQAAGTLAGGPENFACPTTTLCVGIGGNGVYTTTDGATTGWWFGQIAPAAGEIAGGVACPTATTCVVSTSGGIYRGTLTVADKSLNWDWVTTDADPTSLYANDPTKVLKGIACSSPGHCTAVGGGGMVFTTTDPEMLHWEGQILPGQDPKATAPLLAVACPADGVCVAAGERGWIASTTNNWADDSLTQLPVPAAGVETPTLKGVSCTSPTSCMILGDTVLLGARAAAV